MAKRVETAEAAVPSNNSVLMEHITGISAKVLLLVDQWHKGQAPPPQPNRIFASIHAPHSDEKQAGGKSKKMAFQLRLTDSGITTAHSSLPLDVLNTFGWLYKKCPAAPAIFGEEQPAKWQASTNEAQQVQDPYAIPRDWDWDKISAISPLMKGHSGRPCLIPTRLYATATAAPANPAGQPQGPPNPAAKATPPAQTKPKAPVVHVPAPKDSTKLLQVAFSTAVSNLTHQQNELDVREWAWGILAHYGEEANNVFGLHWHDGGVHVDIRFQTRPTVASCNYLGQELEWFANIQGSARTATIDFYNPITQLAGGALRTHNAATQQELSIESIISTINQENPWISECVLTHIQSPKPFWIDPRGGSGTFVFTVYNNRDGSPVNGPMGPGANHLQSMRDGALSGAPITDSGARPVPDAPPDSFEPRGSTPILHCISANMQKSALNHGLPLKINQDSDVIFVQEPFRGYIKSVASSVNADGDEKDAK
ncbi:hypothetical protein BC835DRAFT_1414333 [Cytidiella melzeri]|nr:hypothetical protein BC835DRAFT_1414333 [Cytidiella melzeri]